MVKFVSIKLMACGMADNPTSSVSHKGLSLRGNNGIISIHKMESPHQSKDPLGISI